MPYSATWDQPTYTADWPTPPAGLATVHLIGDIQCAWGNVWPTLSPRTTFDQLTRDMDRGLLRTLPDAAFQVGDVNGGANTVLSTHTAEIRAAQDWLASLGYGRVYPVVGNHDTPGDLIGGKGWANLWGVEAPNYTVDLGDTRLIVLGWDDNHIGEARHSTPVGPYPHALVDWLNDELTADQRPTMVVNHAHLRGLPTGGTDPGVANYGWWEWNQATVDPTGVIDVDANYLRDCLSDNLNVVAWLFGHTHEYWWGYGHHPHAAGEPGPHTTLFDLSTGTTTRRSIAAVDAAALFDGPSEPMQNPVASPFVTLLDDGRTIETRWREHNWHSWVGVPGRGRVQRITTP